MSSHVTPNPRTRGKLRNPEPEEEVPQFFALHTWPEKMYISSAFSKTSALKLIVHINGTTLRPLIRRAFGYIVFTVALSLSEQATTPTTKTQYPVCFSNLELIVHKEGTSAVNLSSSDTEFLSDFIKTRQEWDNRFSTTKALLPYADLLVSSARIIPAPIYAFGKLVIGQEVQGIQEATTQLQRQFVREFLDSRSFNMKRLRLAQEAGTFESEFRTQAGLTDDVWNGLTQDERNDALLILGKNILQEQTATRASLGKTNASIAELYVDFARMHRQLKSLRTELKELKTVTAAMAKQVQAMKNDRETTKVASDYLDGKLSPAQFDEQMQRLGATDSQIKALKDQRNLNKFEHTLRDVGSANQIIQRMFPGTDLAKTSDQLAIVAGGTLEFVKHAAEHDYLGALAAFLGIVSPGDSALSAQLAQIAQEIRNLRIDLWNIYGDLSNRIDAVYELDLAIKDAVVTGFELPLNQCRIFLNSRSHFRYDYDNDRFDNYGDMNRHFKAGHWSQYEECRKHIDAVLQLSNVSVGYLASPQVAAIDQSSRLKKASTSFYSWILPLRYLTESFDTDNSITIGQLQFPSLDYANLSQKLERSKNKEVADAFRKVALHSFLPPGDEQSRFVYTNFYQAISVPALLNYVEMELAINAYSDLAEVGSHHLYEKSELRQADSRRIFEGRDRLLRALDWIELAIAQQTWLHGDALLPMIAERAFSPFSTSQTDLDFYRQGQTPNTAQKKNDATKTALVQLAVATNPILLQNVTRYLLYEEMKNRHLNSFTYAWAASMQNDPFYMNAVSGQKFNMRWDSNPTDPATQTELQPGWYFTYHYLDALAGAEKSVALVPAPPSADVSGSFFVVGSDLSRLLEAREKIKGRLLGYDIVQSAYREGKSESIERIADAAWKSK